MEKQLMILVTGAAGFVGSCVVQYLNEQGLENIILVDKFTDAGKEKNWKHKKYKHLVDRELLLEWLDENKPRISFIIHLGARTDATEPNYNIHRELNVEYSQDVWNYCTAFNIPLIYASAAATYGNGELGYDDDDNLLSDLKPLNSFGTSKNEFDNWAISQLNAPPFWAGLKFFSIYGPNEYHKEQRASMIFHACKQIETCGCLKLFKSNNEEFKDGEQLHDFVYVKDIVKVVWWIYSTMMKNEWPVQKNGIYNVGTGKARTFNDLAKATFTALGREPKITYIDMPADLAHSYQHFAETPMVKLKHAGYEEPFTSLEEGVDDYVKNYLSKKAYY
jgi:ADP-L-glycero-D-manno-heptose 6-epimerase